MLEYLVPACLKFPLFHSLGLLFSPEFCPQVLILQLFFFLELITDPYSAVYSSPPLHNGSLRDSPTESPYCVLLPAHDAPRSVVLGLPRWSSRQRGALGDERPRSPCYMLPPSGTSSPLTDRKTLTIGARVLRCHQSTRRHPGGHG